MFVGQVSYSANNPIAPEKLSAEERPIIEAMCRAICEVTGTQPDMPIIYHEEPENEDWAESPPSPLRSMESQGYPEKQRPQWSNYAGAALAQYRAHKAMVTAMGS